MQQRDLSLKTIDDFIATYPKSTQSILQEVRKVINSTHPDLGEKISYGIPTFTLNGKNLVHFSAYPKHIGFYPGAAPIKAFEKELKAYKTSKGTVQFPIDRPMPLDLIKSMVGYCVKQNMENNSCLNL